MTTHTKHYLPFLCLSIAGLLSLVFFFLMVRLAHGAHPPTLSPSDRPAAQAGQSNAHTSTSPPAYNEPIIFFHQDSNVLVMYPNGDIFHRGRKVTTDQEVVLAMQEILSLSPCRTGR